MVNSHCCNLSVYIYAAVWALVSHCSVLSITALILCDVMRLALRSFAVECSINWNAIPSISRT